MSRSIHETRRMLRDAQREDWSAPGKKQKRINDLEARLDQKRSIKAQVTGEHKAKCVLATEAQNEDESGEVMITSPDPALIPIIVEDENSLVHYPATPDDLRAVMQRLPKGVCDGISRIVLCLGKKDLADTQDKRTRFKKDPHVGRLGDEWLPGVWGGRYFGRYLAEKAEIRIYAFVHPPELNHREPKDFLLRMTSLSVLLHEIGHHHDATRRVARGRWLSEDGDKGESYARMMDSQWLHGIVVPYLEETYPEQTRAFIDWVEHYGGIRLTLDRLAGDPRKYIFDIQQSLRELLDDVEAGKDLAEIRCSFADELHMAEDYENALEIIERLLAEKPESIAARILKADILVHQEWCEAARQILMGVIENEPSNTDAWRQLAFAYEGLKLWDEALDAVARLMELDSQEKKDTGSLIFRIRMLIEKGDYKRADSEIRLLESSELPHQRQRVVRVRRMLQERLAERNKEA